MSILPIVVNTVAAVVLAPICVRLAMSGLEKSKAMLYAHSTLIAQKYAGKDPHGEDPHGDDPHDEQHDDNMEANADEKETKAPKDVYGDKYQNTQAPY